MANKKVSIDALASTIVEELKAYAQLSTEGMKGAVKSSAKTCKSEIKAGAPKKTGKYAKSWTSKTTAENANRLTIAVYSKTPGLPHLLEHGHAKRGGGRVPGKAHIAPAEAKAEKELETEILKTLKG